MDLAQQKQMLMGIAQECKETEDASDSDLGRLVDKKEQITKEGKCLMACILEQMDMVRVFYFKIYKFSRKIADQRRKPQQGIFSRICFCYCQ